MFLGALPYCWLSSNHEVEKYVVSCKRLWKPASMSKRLYEVMNRCWTQKPENRPDFSDLVNKFLDFKWLSCCYLDFDDLSPDDLSHPYEEYERRISQII